MSIPSSVEDTIIVKPEVEEFYRSLEEPLSGLLKHLLVLSLYNWSLGMYICPDCKKLIGVEEILHDCPNWLDYLENKAKEHFTEKTIE